MSPKSISIEERQRRVELGRKTTVATQTERRVALSRKRWGNQEKHPLIRCARPECKRKPFPKKNSRHLYCSGKCKYLHQHPPVRGNIGERLCSYNECGKKYEPIRRDQRYCSPDCKLADYANDFLKITLKIPRKLLTGDRQSATLIVEIAEGAVRDIRSV